MKSLKPSVLNVLRPKILPEISEVLPVNHCFLSLEELAEVNIIKSSLDGIGSDFQSEVHSFSNDYFPKPRNDFEQTVAELSSDSSVSEQTRHFV